MGGWSERWNWWGISTAMRGAACMVAGAAACLGFLGLTSKGSSAAERGAIAGWVLDRDGNALAGLDADRLLVRRFVVPAPVELAAASDGDLWVVSANPASPLGPTRLLLVDDESGGVTREWALSTVLDLETVHGVELSGPVGDEALVVELDSGGERRVSRVARSGGCVTVERSSDAFCAAAAWGCTLVGSERGELRLFGPDGQRLARRAFGGVISDVAPGPQQGQWWVLDVASGAGGARLALLGRDLASRWQVPAGVAALTLAPVEGAERVWLCDEAGAFARRFGPGGVLELAHVDLAHGGASRASAGDDGSLWLAAPGALLCLDGSGAAIPGQGGWEFLVDVERAR
ncbi:MAG: hypothetical protein FJ298_01745 [Planctomycetes bacterium]|nr:hypothetical protein [Planctomycetota bacterium]